MKSQYLCIVLVVAAIFIAIYRSSAVNMLALSNTKEVFEKENAVNTDVNTATSEIGSAISGLELIPNKTKLQAIVDHAESYAEETYTTATYTVFQEAVITAEAILADDDSTQTQVDNALAVLNEAINDLVKSTECVWRISAYLHMTAANHVGNHWSSGVFYSGEQVCSSLEVTAREGSGITITGKAVEHDKIPDVGSGSVYLTLTDENETETTFYVQENRGRYAGNCAVWVLEVSCERIERV